MTQPPQTTRYISEYFLRRAAEEQALGSQMADSHLREIHLRRAAEFRSLAGMPTSGGEGNALFP